MNRKTTRLASHVICGSLALPFATVGAGCDGEPISDEALEGFTQAPGPNDAIEPGEHLFVMERPDDEVKAGDSFPIRFGLSAAAIAYGQDVAIRVSARVCPGHDVEGCGLGDGNERKWTYLFTDKSRHHNGFDMHIIDPGPHTVQLQVIQFDGDREVLSDPFNVTAVD